MPIVKRKEGEKPEGAFLGLHVGNKEVLRIPPGAMLDLVEDANSPSRIFPLVLKSVRRDKIVFTLAGTDYTYKLHSARPLNRDALQRLETNRAK
jgi:hypothetical protein